jgi:hypothetical protein
MHAHRGQVAATAPLRRRRPQPYPLPRSSSPPWHVASSIATPAHPSRAATRRCLPRSPQPLRRCLLFSPPIWIDRYGPPPVSQGQAQRRRFISASGGCKTSVGARGGHGVRHRQTSVTETCFAWGSSLPGAAWLLRSGLEAARRRPGRSTLRCVPKPQPLLLLICWLMHHPGRLCLPAQSRSRRETTH